MPSVLIVSFFQITITKNLKKLEIYCGSTVSILMVPAVQNFDIIGPNVKSSLSSLMVLSSYKRIMMRNIICTNQITINAEEIEVIDSKLEFKGNKYISTVFSIDFNSLKEYTFNSAKFSTITLLENTTIADILISQDNISIKSSESDLIALSSSSVILNLNVDLYPS